MSGIPSRARKRRPWIITGLLLSAALLAYLILGSLEELLPAVGRIEWPYAAAALACALASYAATGLALWETLRLLGCRRPFGEVLGISWVSTTANYLVSSGGASGFALKAYLLRRRRVPYGTTVLAAVVSTALMYFVLGAVIAQGLAYFLLRSRGMRIAALEGALGLGVLALTSVPLLVFFLDHELRGRVARRLFHWTNRAAFALSRREIPEEDFVSFERQLEEGLGLVRVRRGRLAVAIGYTCLEWLFAVLALHCAFLAAGCGLPLGALAAAFAVGQAAALIPLLPGGLGAMEGAMAAVCRSLGAGWGGALAAALFYRFAYYLLPGLGGLFILWGLRASEARWAEPPTPSPTGRAPVTADLPHGEACGFVGGGPERLP